MLSQGHIRIKQRDLADRRFTDVSPRQKNGDWRKVALLSVPSGRFIDKNDSGLQMNHYLCPAYRLQIAALSRCQNKKMFRPTYKACYIRFSRGVLKSWGQPVYSEPWGEMFQRERRTSSWNISANKKQRSACINGRWGLKPRQRAANINPSSNLSDVLLSFASFLETPFKLVYIFSVLLLFLYLDGL